MNATRPRVALVTGGASGIGRATVERLARDGLHVVVSDIDPAGEQVAAAAEGALFVEHDVADEAAWERAIGVVLQAHGRLDVLVNNAGVSLVMPVTDTTLAQWRGLMAINVDGVFLGTKHGLLAMRRHGEGGAIVNVSSASGLVGGPLASAYCASKGAVRLFTKSVALECAAEGIRVNSVHPGAVRTPIWGKAGIGPADEDAIAAASPLGRMAEPEEVADAIAYLASDAARFMTGSELVIDGGYTAG
jgi:3(or 17)beta-hydroxysteroid dehydrogenase